MTPPRKPGALTLSTLSRLGGRVVCGLALVWIVALVGWPERRFEAAAGTVAAGGELHVLLPPRDPLPWGSRPARVGGEYDYIRRFAVPDSSSMPVFWIGYRRDSSPAVILGKLGR